MFSKWRQHITRFYQKHRKVIVIFTMVKFVLKIAFVGWMLLQAKQAKSQTTNSLLREGNKLYKADKYNNATESYSKALLLAPKDVRAHFNQGDALYKLNQLDKAKEHFSMAAQYSKNTDIQARAMYNIGNAWYKQEKYEESVKAYKTSLKLNPKDADAKYNLMMAMAKLKQQNSGGQDKQQQKDNKQDQKQNQQQQQQPQNGNQQQNKNGQQQQQPQSGQQQQQQQQAGQLSNEEAEKLLEVLGSEEGKVQQKLSKEKGKPVKGKVQKDW